MTQTKGGTVDCVIALKPNGAGNIGAKDRSGFTSKTPFSLDEGVQLECLSMANKTLEAAEQEEPI